MKVTFARVLRSEWTKITTLRSTWIVLGVVAVLMVTVAGLIGWQANRGPGAENTLTLAAARAFLGVDLIALIVGVFGVLLITGEYGSGSIRATLAAVPRRLPVLAAKAVALVGLMLPVMVVAAVAALLVSQAFVDGPARVGLDADGMLRATLGAAVAPVAMALIGLGLGVMLRHTAVAITVYVMMLLVVPALLAAILPERIGDDVIRVVPVAASQSLYAIGTSDGGGGLRMLSPGPATVILAAWIVVAFVGGAVVLRRRDA